MIRQSVLAEYLSIRDARRNAERAIRAQKSQEDRVKDDIMTCLANGDKIQRGDLIALVRDGRVSPSWKEEFIAACGADAAEAVISRTLPSQELIVESKHGAAIATTV